MNETNTDVLMSNNVVEILLGMNEASDGWFGGLLLAVLFFIILSSVMTFTMMSFNKALILTSFLLTIVSMLMWSINLISLVFAFLPVVLLIISIGILLFKGS